MNIPSELFSLDTLSAFPGLVIATWAIVQFTKGGIDLLINHFFKDKHWGTEGWVYCVSILLMMGVTFFKGELAPLTVFLNCVNAFFVAMSAMKVHESASKKKSFNATTSNL